MEGALKARHGGGVKKDPVVDSGQKKNAEEIDKATEKSNNKPKTIGK